MRNNDRPSDEHQVIHTNSRPSLPCRALVTCAHLRGHLAALVKEHPDKVTLAHPDRASRCICAIVENEGYRDLSCFDSFLEAEELAPQCFSLGRFFAQGSFRQRLGNNAHRSIGLDLGFGLGTALVRDCLLRVAILFRSRRVLRLDHLFYPLLFIIPKRQELLLLLLLASLGLLPNRSCRCIVTVPGIIVRSARQRPIRRRRNLARRARRCGNVACFALLLLEDFGAALAEVGEVDKADCIGGESLSGVLVLGREAGWRRVGHCGWEGGAVRRWEGWQGEDKKKVFKLLAMIEMRRGRNWHLQVVRVLIRE